MPKANADSGEPDHYDVSHPGLNAGDFLLGTLMAERESIFLASFTPRRRCLYAPSSYLLSVLRDV